MSNIAVATQGSISDQPKRITRALRVELAKPLSESWDSVGPTLRALRGVSHVLLNGAMVACLAQDRANRALKAASAASATESIRKTAGSLAPATAAYRDIDLMLCDAAIADILRELAASAKRKDNGEAFAAIEMPGSMKSALANYAHQAFRKWSGTDKRRTRIPSWKAGAPIMIRRAESHLELDATGAPVLEVKLRPEGTTTFALRGGKGSHWSRLRLLAERKGEREPGDCKLVFDERLKKWFAIISYSEPAPVAPQQCDPEHVMVLHRGQRNLLVAMSNRGRYAVVSIGGGLLALQRRFEARRFSVQHRTRAERGAGGKGHGRDRYFDLPERLAEKQANATKTLCQQIAARVSMLAREWGAGRILIEDYQGIAPDEERAIRRFVPRIPNHQLRECVAWSLKKLGLELDTYSHEYISQTCPRCGSVDDSQHNRRTGIFHCAQSECGFERKADFVAPLHALRRACGNAGDWEEKIK